MEHTKYQCNGCTTAYEQYVTGLLSPCNGTPYIYTTCVKIKVDDKTYIIKSWEEKKNP
jgi:hypothetical protein